MLDEKDRPLGEVKVQQVKENAEIDDLLDFSPYHDDPEEHATGNGKQLPPIPQDENSTPTSRRSIIHKVVVSVVTVIIGLFIIFIVLHTTGFFREFREERQRERLQNSPPRSSPSRNFALNFPQQYPPLDIKRSSEECRTAWQTLTEIQCHDSIWTRNWDSGAVSFLGPSLDQFVPLICDARCAPALEEARNIVQSACSKEDVFDVNRYKGRFNVELLESGPADVMDVLVERQSHMCRRSPTGDAERGTCMTDVNSRWGIVDGIRVNGTQTLRWFLDGTKDRKVEPAGMHRGMQGSGRWSEKYSYWREERKIGPGRGETTCSWCTLDWLQRKLPSWEKDMVDWDGSAPTLPEYLRIWENAGKRCAGDDFMEAYRAAVRGYIDRGLLEANWETKPSGDIPYLMQHRPTAGDFPARDVDLMLEKMKDYRKTTEKINPTLAAQIKHQADVNEYIGCLESFKIAVQDIECYPFLSKDEISVFVLSDIDTAQRSCSTKCLDSIETFRRNMYGSCKSAFAGKRYSHKLRFVGHEAASFVENFFEPESTISTFETSCRPADNWSPY